MSDDAYGPNRILWETCFWITFPGNERFLAEILDRRFPPELSGVVLRLRSETHPSLTHPSLTHPTASESVVSAVASAHPEFAPRTSFSGMFPVFLEAPGGGDEPLFLVLAGVDDGRQTPELTGFSDRDDEVREELLRLREASTDAAPLGSRAVCNDCWNERQWECDFCGREVCQDRWIEMDERVHLCGACHLALWIRGSTRKGVRVARDPKNPGRFTCTSERPWSPACAFVHDTCHPDSDLAAHESPFEDLSFEYYRCPHCKIVFFETFSK